jgi:hypothetical protein
MARWTDLAEWRGPTVNEGDGDGMPGEPEDHASECRGMVVHIAEGTYEGTISWQHNASSDVSSHFVVAKDGRAAQMVDTDDIAWTQRAGNGHWLSIENEGRTPGALTAAQVETNAQLLARGHQVYGYPLQIATSPDGRGLGHHSMGTNGRSVSTDTWTGPTWGHEQCPGPAIIAQKPAIVARARAIITGGSADMELTDKISLPQRPDVHYSAPTTTVAGVLASTNYYVLQTRNLLGAALAGLDAKVDALTAIIAGGASPDSAAILAALDQRLAALRAELEAATRDAVADLAEGGAAQVRGE